MDPIPKDLENIVTDIIDAAYNVHLFLGNNLLESAYEKCLTFELQDRGYNVETQLYMPITFKGRIIPIAYRLDLLINKSVIVEIKVIEEVLPVHISQVLTYLRFSDLRMGLIINFKEKYFGDAVKRVVR
jgi:GxxExxY protein